MKWSSQGSTSPHHELMVLRLHTTPTYRMAVSSATAIQKVKHEAKMLKAEMCDAMLHRKGTNTRV
jgi:hypothetical protein